jgi:hypothetical protein
VFKVFVSVCVVVCCSHINSAHVCRTVRSPACNELLIAQLRADELESGGAKESGHQADEVESGNDKESGGAKEYSDEA